MNLVSSFTYKPDAESFLQSKQLQQHLQRQGEVFFYLGFQSSGKDGSVHPAFKSLDFRSFMQELRELRSRAFSWDVLKASFFHTP